MENIRIKAYGKINISLDVTDRRADGYHLVSMIMQSVTLCDYITVSKRNDRKILVLCDNREVPTGRDNIAYKAAEKLIDKCEIAQGVSIKIEKNIPMAAGMAGGSADAAAVIKGMNAVFELGLSMAQMDEIALSLGADVPFCLRKGTYLAEGIGEKLTRLRDLPEYNIVVLNPGILVSTREIYQKLDSSENIVHPETSNLLGYIEDGRWDDLFKNMVNVLEPVTSNLCKDIGLIEAKLLELGAIGCMMTGSGPTVFGIFATEELALRAFQYLKTDYKGGNTLLCKLAGQE